MDRLMKQDGWTHRWKRKSKEPYVRSRDIQNISYKGEKVLEVIDQQGKFRTIPEEELYVL